MLVPWLPWPMLGAAHQGFNSVSFPPTVLKKSLHLYDKIQEITAITAVGPFFSQENEAYIPKQKFKEKKKSY